MRLHRLTATAFGPFAGTVDIDFDEVSSAGLFLVRGATGAGKTSLLDAVCFALYAAVPGSRPSGRSLRSDHAPRDVVPTVTLEFTASGRRFRVERSPEFLRPKKRGEGETRAPARVVLHEQVGGSWVGRDHRHDDVAAVLTEVLGMGLEQFSKVVLLPQGDFAAFLRATPEARRELLERLFDISTFAGVEDWLAAERRRTGDAVAGHRADLATDLARLADAVADVPWAEAAPAGSAPAGSDPVWSDLAPREVPARLDGVRAHLEARAGQALAELDHATAAAGGAQAALRDAERVAGLQARARRATDDLAALDATAESHQRALELVDGATRAASVRGDLAAAGRAAASLVEAKHAASRSLAGLAGFGLDDRGLAEVRAWAQRLHESDPTLDDADRRARLAADSAARADSLRTRASAALRRAAEVEARRLVEQDRLARAAAAVEAAATAQRAEPGLAAGADTLRTILALRRRHDQEAVQRRSLQARRDQAVGREQEARDLLLDLREARVAGLAGELAQQLAEGSPCPVCGSCAHPDPAVTAEPVTADQVEAAEAGWGDLRDAREALERELASSDAAARSREESLAGDARSADELAEALSEVEAEAARARALASTHQAATTTLAAAQESVSALAADAEHQRAAAGTLGVTARDLDDAATTEAGRVAELLALHAATCPCAEGAARPASPASSAGAVTAPASTEGASSTPEAVDGAVAGTGAAVAEALGHHRAVARAADAHVEALVTCDLAAREQATAASALHEALAAVGFATADDARGAVLPEDHVRALQDQVRAHDRARTAAQTVLADPEVTAAAALPTPDLEALVVVARDRQSVLQRAQEAETLARRTLAAVERIAPSLRAHAEAVGPATERHDLVRDLADTFAGTGPNNALRMRLSSFVLAARLERVADLANERLALMGEGRYRLQHSDDLAARGARSGLGLRVLDLWTGQSRETSTLSGGEAFMASLALALGLADAVREESGGFDLQTLFVDEGFGTLDDESLEQVMAVLDSLREGGRAVGVVSHVAELRTRIPCQVIVDKTETGSTVRVVGAGRAEPAA